MELDSNHELTCRSDHKNTHMQLLVSGRPSPAALCRNFFKEPISQRMAPQAAKKASLEQRFVFPSAWLMLSTALSKNFKCRQGAA